jgi:hypothetical protein
MYRHEHAIIEVDDLSVEFDCDDAEAFALAAEIDFEGAIADGDGSGVTVHVEGARVWLVCAEHDDAALDEAIEIFGNFIEENFGNPVLIAALDVAGKPL